MRVDSVMFKLMHDLDRRSHQVVAKRAGKIGLAEPEHVLFFGAAQHLRDKRIRQPMADPLIHISVIGPKSLEPSRTGIKFRQPILDGHLGQPAINRLTVVFETFGAISLEDGSIEIPESEKNRRGPCLPLLLKLEDLLARLKNLLDDPAVIRFIGFDRSEARQDEKPTKCVA